MSLLDKPLILVTGADGFIGSHLVEVLLRRGCHVRAFMLYNSSGSWGHLEHLRREDVPRVEVVLGDIRDAAGVRTAMTGCEVVLHLAALISIPHSYAAPESYVATNVTGTLNLLLAARDLGVARFVTTSTSEVYGTARRVPIDEEHALSAQSPYAATKIAADQMALAFHRSYGVPVTVLRPFNTYGPRQSARAVIPTIISQISAGQRHLRLGSVHPTRDFSFVADTVDAFIAVAEADAAVGEVINSGSGFEISIGDTARLIARLMEKEIEIDVDSTRVRPTASEVERLVANSEKARQLTGWSPRYGGLEGFQRGLVETIAWFADAANLASYAPRQYQV